MEKIFFNTNKIWYWNSNKNPWNSSSDEDWVKYSKNDNEKINKAFLSGEEKVALEEYVLVFESLLQYNCIDSYKARPIMYKDIITPERFYETLPIPTKKTTNKIKNANYPICLLKFKSENQMRESDLLSELKSISDKFKLKASTKVKLPVTSALT